MRVGYGLIVSEFDVFTVEVVGGQIINGFDVFVDDGICLKFSTIVAIGIDLGI